MLRIVLPMAAALALAAPSFAADNNKAANKPAAHHSAAHMAWASQTVSGKLTIVDPAKKLVVIQTAGGVPYDLDVTRQTRIENGNQRVSLGNLNQDVNQNVQVKLVPERRGDVAAWIKLGS